MKTLFENCAWRSVVAVPGGLRLEAAQLESAAEVSYDGGRRFSGLFQIFFTDRVCAMYSGRQTDVSGAQGAVQAIVLDVLRRRAAGEPLSDDEVIASRPDLGERLRAELAKLKQICDAAGNSNGPASAEATTDFKAGRTPGLIQIRCPHCREPFETATDTPVAEMVCSACGGHFSLASNEFDTRQAPSLKTLAHFDLIERLGVGGFGTVWKARDQKLDRTVAIKIPRHGTLNDEDLEKFLREARAAAQLQHPSIIRVHEVGRDGDSVFIVSDFVRGIPLNDWLTGQQPTSRQAVELCEKIAAALEHAHERGVIHRDLKPANILIDGEGQPHLMDFGLARREVGEVTLTLDGQVLGTPAYMSPEQARGESHSADARSDIYSLGVVLFELLTGELPFRGNSRMIIHQVVHEPAPSPRKFNGNVPKDLETITLKCLEKEPAKRYATAGELAEEFRRYLAGKPIYARPIGRAARTWRWAKRRPAMAAIWVLLVAIAAGSAAAFLRERHLREELVSQKNEIELQKKAADSARDNAEAVVSFLTNDVLGKADPEHMPDKSVRDKIVEAMIEPAAKSVGKRFTDTPLIEAAIRKTLADSLTALGQFELAHSQAEKALELRRNGLGADHPDTLQSVNTYALVLVELGRAQDAMPLYRENLERCRKVFGEESEETIEALSRYAMALLALDRAIEAEPLVKLALNLRQKPLDYDQLKAITALRNYGLVLTSLERHEEAVPIFKYVLEQSRKWHDPDLSREINDYAFALSHAGRRQEAAALYAEEQEREFSRETFGRLREEVPLAKERWETSSKLLGEDDPRIISALTNYAKVLVKLGRTKEAEPLKKKLLDLYSKYGGEDDHLTVMELNGYTDILKQLGRFKEAEPLLERALIQNQKVFGLSNETTVCYKSRLVTIYRLNGHLEEAAKTRDSLCADILGLSRKASPWESYWGASALLAANRLAENRRICEDLLRSYSETGRIDYAERATAAYVVAAVPESQAKQLVKAVAAATKLPSSDRRIFAACWYRAGEYERAINLFTVLLRKFKPRTRDHCFLAMLHAQLGHNKEAVEALSAAREAFNLNEEVEWYERVEAETLLAEATQLIETKSTASAK